MWWVAAAYAAKSIMDSQASNDNQDRIIGETQRRNNIQVGIAENQLENNLVIARDKMTDVSKQFLLAKGQSKVVQAETMVSGNVSKRLDAVRRTKASKAKSDIATDTDTNAINIAQDIMFKQIDSEAQIASANSKKKNTFTMMADAGIAGMQGYAAGASMSSAPTSIGLTGNQSSFLDATKGMTADRTASIGATWTQAGVFNN